MREVTMTLTEKDIANVERVAAHFTTGNKVDAVRNALQIFVSLSEMIQRSDEVIIRQPNGASYDLIIPGIND